MSSLAIRRPWEERGNGNVIIGAGAVFDNAVGDNNTFIGANVDFNSLFGNNDIFIGANTGTQGSHDERHLPGRREMLRLRHRSSGEQHHPHRHRGHPNSDAYIAGIYPTARSEH